MHKNWQACKIQESRLGSA